MKTFKSFDEALHYAINSAKDCAELYTRLSEQARNNKMRRLFEKYSREQYAQMVNLSRIRFSFSEVESSGFPFSLDLYDCRQANEGKNPTYIEALVVAMRKARSSHKLYNELASKAPDEDSAEILQSLAIRETNHRQGIEIEYNESLLLFC